MPHSAEPVPYHQPSLDVIYPRDTTPRVLPRLYDEEQYPPRRAGNDRIVGHKPAIFSGGGTELPGWLGSFLSYARTARVPPSDWAALALTYLPDDVREYIEYKTCSSTIPSFELFQQLLFRKYNGVASSIKYGRLVNEARQGPTETLEAFGARFRRLVYTANYTGPHVSTSTAIDQYLSGLRDAEVQHYLIRKRNADLERMASHEPLRYPTLDHYVRAATYSELNGIKNLRPPKEAGAAVAALVQPTSKPVPVATTPSVATPGPTVDVEGAVKQLVTLLTNSPAPVNNPRIRSASADRVPQSQATYLCFNCNKIGHVFRNCPEPIENEKIDKKWRRLTTEGQPLQLIPARWDRLWQ